MYNSASLADSGASNLPPAVTPTRKTQATCEINHFNSISACIRPCYMSNTTLKSTVSSCILIANHLPCLLTVLHPIFSHSTLLSSYSLLLGFHPPSYINFCPTCLYVDAVLLGATDLEVSLSLSAEKNVLVKVLITWWQWFIKRGCGVGLRKKNTQCKTCFTLSHWQ